MVKMRVRVRLGLVILLCCLGSRFSEAQPCHVILGDTKVIIQQYYYGQGKAFVHLHQNETTALQAAKVVIQAEGGSILTLVHAGGRNVVFHLNRVRYEFDPNRIFTEVGIRKTLRQFGPYSLAAHREVRRLACAIKAQLPRGKIIAVHNNKSYSLKSYLPGHELADDAQALQLTNRHSYRNFFLVTQKEDYVRLKNLVFNSIWQSRSVTDDGSLSVYLARRNYVNVEAGYGQLTAQVKMLEQA